MRNPGWIDLQVNGCSGIDFSSPELTGDDFLRAAERVLESGTGCFLPTLITSPFGLYRRNLGVIRRAVVRHGLEREVPGVHLEGPFISADPGAAGAHNPDWVVPAGSRKSRSAARPGAGFREARHARGRCGERGRCGSPSAFARSGRVGRAPLGGFR